MNYRDSEKFSKEYDSVLSRMGTNLEKVLREDPIWQSPTFQIGEGEILVTLARIPLQYLKYWILVADYVLEDSLRGFLKFQLQLQIERFPYEERSSLILLKQNKYVNRLFVMNSGYFGNNPEEFFGELGQLETQAPLIFKVVKKRNPKVNRPQRKRGYHDHGTLRPQHKWLPRSDWSLTDLQNYLEESIDYYTVSLPDFLFGWIT